MNTRHLHPTPNNSTQFLTTTLTNIHYRHLNVEAPIFIIQILRIFNNYLFYVLLYCQVMQYMLGNGKMECVMVEVNNGGKMVRSMKATEEIIKLMVMEGILIIMGKFILVIGLMIRLKGMGCLFLKMERNMRDSG